MMKYPEIPIEKLISFVEEDAPFGDITSDAVIDCTTCTASVTARQELVLAGAAEATTLAEYFRLEIMKPGTDGAWYTSGDEVLAFSGSAHAILLLERTILNILGRMSGIATLTRRLQDMVTAINPSCRIAATRKTAPGLRLLDKKAAMIGGADPHRFSLSDAVLIKDNHRVLTGIEEAIRRAKEAGLYHRIEAEADTTEEAVLIAQAEADIILLDNMSPRQVSETISALTQQGLRDRVVLEVSGGITTETLPSYAALDIDRISLGILTHSVTNADLSLDILK